MGTTSRRNIYRVGAAAAVLIGGAGAAWRWIAGSPEHPSPVAPSTTRPLTAATIATVSYTTAPRQLEATGTVRAEMESDISTKIMGRVVRMLVREGDAVRQGQPLIVLDARDLDAAVAQAGAGLRAASVGRDTALVAERMEKSMSEARIVEARARVTQANAAIQATQAKVDLVESGPRKQERAQASLAVAQAKSNLALAESSLRRMESLVSDGAISRQQYDTYRAGADVAKSQYDAAVQSQSITDEGSRAEEIRAAREQLRESRAAQAQAQAGVAQAEAAAHQIEVRRQEVRGAEAQIGQTRAALTAAQVTRGYASVTAPFDGVVAAKLADPGAMATPGSPLLKIQGDALRLEAVVPESGLAGVRVGQVIPVRLDAIRAPAVRGRISEISPQGDVSSHTFLVKITLPAGSGAKSGMFGRASFTLGEDKRLLLPRSAVVEREGLTYVYTVDREVRARLRLVTVGQHIGDRVAILSGLKPGERVVTSNLDGITDGAAIRETAGGVGEQVAGR